MKFRTGGPGENCVPFVMAGAEVTGVDICEDLGNLYSHAQVRYNRSSIEGCDLRSDQFDVIFCIATMEHVQNIEAGFREMVRLCRPGGFIYSVAAPLWNSRRGHHMDCLNPFPWIHLRMGRDEIVRLGHERGIKHEGIDLSYMMDYLFVSDYFNRAPAHRYLIACRDLPVSKIIRHDLWMDGEDELSSLICEELKGHGYTKDELLATSHTFIAQK